MTFQRLVQSSVEDIAYAQRIGRLRDFYLSVVPELEPHVLVVRGPHAAALLHHQRLGPSGWQLALTTAGMVAVINSVLIGACAGLVVQTVGIHPLAITLAAGAAVAAAAQLVQPATTGAHATPIRPEAVDRAAIFVPTAQQDNTT